MQFHICPLLLYHKSPYGSIKKMYVRILLSNLLLLPSLLQHCYVVVVLMSVCTFVLQLARAPLARRALYLCARPPEHAGSFAFLRLWTHFNDKNEQRATGRGNPETANSPNLKQRKTVDARAAPSPQYVTRGGRGQNMSKSFAGLSPSPPPSSRRRPSRTRFMDVRSKRVYTGPRQPHQSRMKMLGLDRQAVSPGPGQYNPGNYTHNHSPRFSFGKGPSTGGGKEKFDHGKRSMGTSWHGKISSRFVHGVPTRVNV